MGALVHGTTELHRKLGSTLVSYAWRAVKLTIQYHVVPKFIKCVVIWWLFQHWDNFYSRRQS
jgi:hypothetical protein